MSKVQRVNVKPRHKYITVYSKDDYQRDEKSFQTAVDGKQSIQWDKFKRLMMHDLCMANILETNTIGLHRIDDIQAAIQNPRHQYRILMDTSDYLMRVSPHYYRLNELYSNMPVFHWGLDIYDVKESVNTPTMKKNYTNLASKLESMNLKHEFSKIMKVLPYQDIFCGFLLENQQDFFIQQVDFRICKLVQVQDGMYNFAINLTAMKKQNLGAYPDYVQQAYLNHMDGKTGNWYMPPADKQICIKFNTQWTYPFPFLISLIQDILDLRIYKQLKLQSARTDNYKAIMIKVPIDDNTVDKPLLTPKTLGIFAQMNRESMSDDIAILHTLGEKGEQVSFKDSNNTRNNVADGVDDIYNSAGTTKELYNGSSSGTAVKYSVENDAGFIYAVYRQFERWMNRYIKLRNYNKRDFKFSFYLLDSTIFNRDDVSKRYKEACTLGAPVIDKWLSTLDMTPSKVMGSFVLHQDIFNYHNNFVPLSSSYNSSADSGRPSNESQGKTLDESGEITANADSNTDR